MTAAGNSRAPRFVTGVGYVLDIPESEPSLS